MTTNWTIASFVHWGSFCYNSLKTKAVFVKVWTLKDSDANTYWEYDRAGGVLTYHHGELSSLGEMRLASGCRHNSDHVLHWFKNCCYCLRDHTHHKQQNQWVQEHRRRHLPPFKYLDQIDLAYYLCSGLLISL